VAGLVSGLAVGLLFGLFVFMLASGLAVTPEGGLAGGLASGLTSGLTSGLAAGLAAGITAGAMSASGPARDLALMELTWTLCGAPVHFIPLIQTALERQVLRQAGAIYQFRHAALQDLLTAYKPSK
jgi:hypothetical protein